MGVIHTYGEYIRSLSVFWVGNLTLIMIISWVLIYLFRPKDFPLAKNDILGTFTAFLIGIVIGLVLAVQLLQWDVYRNIIDYVPRLYNAQGNTISFAIIFSILFMYIYVKKYKKGVSFLDVTDYCGPFLTAQVLLFNIGSLIAGYSFGKPTGANWGLRYPIITKKLLYPTQLYYICAGVIVFTVMRYLYKKGMPRGVTTFGTIILYSVFVFIIEFFRGDVTPMFYAVTITHISMLVLFLFGVLGLVFSLQKR